MSEISQKTYERFAEFLQKRLETKQHHLTEDSVRYVFFLAVIQTTAIQQHEIILELPHPHSKFKGKEIDTKIEAGEGRPEIFIEFKFHRKTKSSSGKPNKAGTLFKDISRLAALKPSNKCRCLVVYLTCGEMVQYFKKNAAAYSQFWSQPSGGNFIYDDLFVAKTTDTFRKASSEHHPARVSVEFSALIQDYQLRVFEVREK